MGKKIAIIATDFLEQFIKDMITELDMGFQYHIFTYEKFEDIKDIYKKIGPEYDGILTSGSFPAHMIHLYYPEEKRPIGCLDVYKRQTGGRAPGHLQYASGRLYRYRTFYHIDIL